MTKSVTTSAPVRGLFNKVPEVTGAFWAIKIMATTVGETGADYLIFKMGLGLPLTSALMAGVVAVVLLLQFWTSRYRPWVYWPAVTAISVMGTLVTDSLVDTYGVALTTTTTVFALLLIATFAVWFARERTLSIHAIDTSARVGFYWLAILFTFALGTATGDLLAERLSLGYLPSTLLFGAGIAAVFAAWRGGVTAPVLSFWLAYVLTRPLGASLGDLLSQPIANGGLGLGTNVTSEVFLAAILGLVAWLSISRIDLELSRRS